MFISKNWLEQFISLPPSLSPESIAEKLKLSTVEVEGIDTQGELLDHVVVGKVISCEKHPNADRLKVCAVDVGDDGLQTTDYRLQKTVVRRPRHSDGQASSVGRTVQLVCGGSNVRDGMYVAVALPGAKVRWHGEGEPVALEKTTIRGVESYGMICASDEIGLGEMFSKKEEKEILNIADCRLQIADLNTIVGKPLAEVLGLNDVIFEIDHKSLSNRPDLWGHYGMAREIAALFKGKLKPYKPSKIKPGKEIKLSADVREKKLCPRYMAVAMEGITIAPSPQWMQVRLRSAGVRPINNIVDITNYVMMELGQPTHAFDAEKIGRQTTDDRRQTSSSPSSVVRSPLGIVVRRAKAGERIMTLDGKERVLTTETLVIADADKPMAIAGVMGGSETEITGATTTVLFESANFDAAIVRTMSQTLGLRTEGSARWEKSQDPVNAELGLRRLVELTLQLCPSARVASNVIDVFPKKPQRKTIILPLDAVHQKLGAAVPMARVKDILSRLGFGVRLNGKKFSVTVPTWRATKDISIPEDIVEEIIRIYGYDKVSPTLPTFPMAPPHEDRLRIVERRLRESLAYVSGFTEVYNYSFVSPEWLARLGVDASMYLALEKPLAKDRPLIRRSLIPNILENVEMNLHRFPAVKLFEIGRVFLGEEHGDVAKHGMKEFLPKQINRLGIVYAQQGVETPFFDVSSAIRGACDALGIAVVFEKQTPADDAPFLHPGRFAQILINGTTIGKIGELHPVTRGRLGIDVPVAIAELDLSDAWFSGLGHASYTPVPSFPYVERDIAFFVDKKVPHADVERAMKSSHSLVRQVELFDVYDGQGIEAGKKSMAYHISYGRDDRTLSSGEVDEAHGVLAKLLSKTFQAEVRKQ
ncbi:MAG: phenylalanine--tRNA ligase subunit beta [Patescibacteria group bacterium]